MAGNVGFAGTKSRAEPVIGARRGICLTMLALRGVLAQRLVAAIQLARDAILLTVLLGLVVLLPILIETVVSVDWPPFGLRTSTVLAVQFLDEVAEALAS